MTRIGASQAFFNIVAQFNAEKLIRDTRSLNTVMRAVSLDTFEAILKPVDDMILQMDNAINAIKDMSVELADATVEFEKFYGATEDLEGVKDDLIGVGEAYAFVGTEALAAGSRAAQVANIIGRQNVQLLVEQAAILAEISDLTLEEAQRGIIQLNQQAGILYGEMTRQQLMSLGARQQEIILTENAARSLDVLNTVANRSVALEGDLVKTMTNFASGAKLAGDSFEFMAAASATLLEAGEEQGTAGRALRMMYARLGGDINGARSKVEALGFELTNADGNMKSMQGTLQELHDKGWAQLNPAMKQNIAQTIAGNRHYVRFIKLMENYERTTQLTADAFQRLDSAQEQADKALDSNVRKLQKAEAQVENLKAAVGEGLMPFMIESTKVQRDFLAATEHLTDGLGGLGGAVGRGVGFFRMTEGFLKFGIGLQSISIGLDMFSSVQRSLRGVEVAMANLHSKQAAFLDYGVTATREQKNLMQGQLFMQQNINRANKEIQLAKMLMVGSDEKLKQNAERRAELEENIKNRATELLYKEHELITTYQYQNETLAAGDSIYGKRAARINYENQMGQELLAVQKEIYAHKAGAEDAYMRQMLADFNVFGSFNEDELRALKRKNEKLREQHTILQQVKAENQATRDLRYYDEEAQEMASTRRLGMLELSKRERRILYSTIAGEAAKAEKVKGQLDAKATLTDREEELLGLVTRQIGQYSTLTRELKENEGSVRINDEAFKGLMAVMKQVNGELMATDRAVRTVTAAEKDQHSITSKILSVQGARGALMKKQKLDKAELVALEQTDAALLRQIEPLLKVVSNAEEDRAKKAEKMAEIISLLTRKEKDYDDALKARRKQLSDEYKQSDQFIKDKERSAMAYKSLAMSTSSLASILSGTFLKGTAGAAASMGIMGTQIAGASLQVGKSSMEFAKLQTKIYYAQLGIEGATTKMQKFNATMFALTRTLAPLVAVGGILWFFAKRQEDINKALAEGRDLVGTMDNALGRFSNTGKLFGSDEGLADTLGIANYSLKELLGNTDLTAKVYDQLNNHGKDFNDTISASVDDAKDLLEALMGIQGASKAAVSESELDAQMQRMEKALRGGTLTGLRDITGLTPLLGGMRYNESEMKEFYKSINKEFRSDIDYLADDKSPMQRMVTDIMTMFEKGMKLTDEQMGLLKDALKDKDLFQLIKDTNDMFAMSGDDAQYYKNQMNDYTESTKQGVQELVGEMENLTEEMYSFGNAREELFFGGKYGNVTGGLYKQIVTQGVGTLYHKNEIIMSNNFHGFFNEREAADRIIAVLDQYVATQG